MNNKLIGLLCLTVVFVVVAAIPVFPGFVHELAVAGFGQSFGAFLRIFTS